MIVSAGKAPDRTPLPVAQDRTTRRHLALSHDGGTVSAMAVAERTAHIPGIAA
ncbi:hypothetical protein AB0K00_37735 [Dactylosporangium sp. NPDC049525]|uniref:hypothetical protein n=1 Tax=Dactylosporangium sp. NPDC049525 TaxID=3154730 RepID=UPI003445E13D